ncbi:MAG: AAA family ATPase [Gemmatimonadales bacterium]
MLPWRLFCLGHPVVVGPDGEPVRLRTRKHLALLIYLAIEPPVSHRRDRLAALLWPRATTEEGRHSLATALSMLRGRLGAHAFAATRETIRLLPGHVVTDVAQLLAGDVLEGDVRAAPFLDEFDVPAANDFATWVDAQRARLRPVLHAHLVDQIDAARRGGDAIRLEQLAARLRRIDPLSEQAARAAMEARALAGDRIGALRDFDRWRALLAEELGAVPSREVDRIADRLRRRGLERTAQAPLAPVPTEQWQERVFVGRAEEYRLGYDLWETARTGRARHLLVRAADGHGKTTLLARLGTALALEGAAVARVQCYELERELPFGVIGSLVGQLLDLPGASATPPSDLAELGRMVGKVRQRWASLPPPSDVTGEEARLQFTEAVLALATAIAEEQPLVVLLDDIHLADATSLAVLHVLLRRMADLPVLALLSSDEGSADDPPAIRRLAEQGEAIGLTVVPLAPLGPAASSALLDRLLEGAEEPGPTVRRAILAGAGGVPMLLEMLVADWRRRGDGALALSLGAMTREATPDAVSRLVDGTLADLDPGARAVANLGAILGQRLNDLGMYTLVDLPVVRTMRAMSTLTTRRLLRDAGSHLEFANEAVRAQCYAAMAAPLRRRLHSMVADRLIAEAGTAEALGGLEVAWHLVRGDRLAEAVPHLLAGGRESIWRGAPHEADLALSTGMPLLEGAARRTAILLLAEAQQELGRWPESLALLDGADEAWDAEERHQREVLSLVGRRFAIGMGSNESRHAVGTLCLIARCGARADTRVRALSAVPYLQSQCRDPESLEDFGAAISSLEDESLQPYERLHLAMAKAWYLAQTFRLDEALFVIAEGMAVADREGIRSSIAFRLTIGKGALLLAKGRYGAAQGALADAQALSERLDNPVHHATCAAALAIASGRAGHPEGQLRWARKALRCLPKEDYSILALSALNELGSALLAKGDLEGARDVVVGLGARCAGGCPPWAVQASLLFRADLSWLIGDRRDARSLAQQAIILSEGAPLIPDVSGAYSRWTSLLAEEADGAQEALHILTSGPLSTRALHHKDQIEWLAAVVHLKRLVGRDLEPELSALTATVSETTAAVRARLTQLGFSRGLAAQ